MAELNVPKMTKATVSTRRQNTYKVNLKQKTYKVNLGSIPKPCCRLGFSVYDLGFKATYTYKVSLR